MEAGLGHMVSEIHSAGLTSVYGPGGGTDERWEPAGWVETGWRQS